MKASLAQREPEILKFWREMGLYQTLQQQRQNAKQTFILCDGPPYANGPIHLGHALNKILKDIINKAQLFSGFNVPYIPGWDCHGLPIELNVEKKLGKAGDAISAAEFRQACRDYALSQITLQKEGFERLGVLGDWEHPYRTMDAKFEADIVRALAKIIANGHIMQGFKPVHWCLDCGSALAEAEVEYANKVSPAIDVGFRVIDAKAFPGEGELMIPIWTTTPWTLPANEAVAINPDFEYVLIAFKMPTPRRLIVAAELLSNVLTRYGIQAHEQLGRYQGKELDGLKLQHPFYQKQVPLILGRHVTADTGTGAVHTAPAHGLDDYIVAQQYHLPIQTPVGKNGCYLPNTELFAGEHVLKVHQHIIDVLIANQNLLAKENLEHSYPHCWRHKTPLIFLATPQWFVKIPGQSLQTQSCQAAEKVTWVPEWGMANMVGMVSGRPDWCISRQRNWGTPITIFIHKETKQMHSNTVNLMHQIADQIEQNGMEAWFSSTPEQWLGTEGKNYEKINDVLDVWFDSGVIQYCVLQQRPELHFPANLVLEGSDQYRGWFQSMLITAVAMQLDEQRQNEDKPAIAPYQTVISHGFTVDDKGRKMSKSLGNVIAPDKIWNSLGADMLRLWVSSTDYTREIPLSDEILKRLSEGYRRIRNTARYFLSNLFDFGPAHVIAPENMLSLDRWAIERTALIQQQILQAYQAYDFHLIYQLIHNFCIVDMGGFYLDIIKDRQYTLQQNSLPRRSAQTAMFHILHAMVRWLAPILSFTAEEMWRYIPGQKEASVFLSTWYQNLAVVADHDPLVKFGRQDFWQTVIQVRDAVNREIERYRNNAEIGSSLEAEVKIYLSAETTLFRILSALKNELRFVLITSKAEIITETAPIDAATATINNETLAIQVFPSLNTKCVRCWHRRDDIGSEPDHPEICLRCVENVIGEGEQRQFA